MSGFYFVVRSSNGATTAWHSAALQGMAITGLIRDAVAEYTMTQTFKNPFAHDYIDGVYTFPLYEGAAVTSFQAEVDGRTIQGRVAERLAAQEDYDAAVRDGKTASLLEQQSSELFQARIGNVPPEKTVVTRITVVSEMRHDREENHVRFVLPTAVAPRASFFGTHGAPTSATKLHFDVGCAMSTPIVSVQSPSHTIEVHVGGDDRSAAIFDPTRARVSLTEDAFLDRDLVVIVQCRGLDQPRALVERHARDGTHAVALTFQPRFAVALVRAAELVFVVDVRSGAPAPRAAEALALFLKHVPLENHYYNVMARSGAFTGAKLEALFPVSIEVTAESLQAGIKYADCIGSGSGASGLVREVLQRRRRDVPTQIFLITDGETADLAQEVRSEGDVHEFRLFALGIGDAISHQRIQSVARAGRGYAHVVTTSERLEKKVSNMMRAALMPPVTEVTIQWTDQLLEVDGEDDQGASAINPQLITLFSDSDTPLAVAESTQPPKISATIYQAPFTLPILCPGARFTVYAILSPTTPLPKEVVVRGVTPGGPAGLRVQVGAVVEGETMLHSLAARALARDFEDAASSVHALGRRTLAAHEKRQLKHLGVRMASPERALPLSFNHIAEITKQKLIDIGENYCLSTKYTSWVAVDEDGPRNTRDVASYIVSFGHTTAPAFGHHPVNSLPSSGVFGGFTGAQRQPAFGAGAVESAPPSAFGATQASALGSQFQASSTPGFGNPFQASSAQAFGGTPAPAFGSLFQASSAPTFGGTQAAGFRSPSQASSVSAFGAPQPSAFGAPQPSAFGAPQPSAFGAPQPSAFGAPQPSAFGAPQPSAFGAPQPSAFGAPQPSAFGAPQPSAFGAPQPSAFGAPQPSAFGAPQPSAFGAPQPSAFGAQTVASLFSSSGNTPAATDPEMRLRSLLQHQMFDGLFPLVPAIAALLNTSVDNLKAKLGEIRQQGGEFMRFADGLEQHYEAFWATCLAVEFVKSKMPELQEQWKLAVEKAERRLESLVQNPERLAHFKAAAQQEVLQ